MTSYHRQWTLVDELKLSAMVRRVFWFAFQNSVLNKIKMVAKFQATFALS